MHFGSVVVMFSAFVLGSAPKGASAQQVVGDQASMLVASVVPEVPGLPGTSTEWKSAVFSPSAAEGESSSVPSIEGEESLPDAPSVVISRPALEPMIFGMQGGQSLGTAPKYSMTISAGWKAQQLTAGEKMIAGARDIVSPISLAGLILSAGYSHITDGQPNYGVNSEAFAKRVGAAAARTTSQTVFSEIVLAPLFRQDARYYVKGPQYGFFNRTMYAITRPLIGRTDGGRSTVNSSLLLGYAGAAAMTPLYYPDINHNFRDVASTFGGSIGGAAIGFFVSEFSDQVLQAVHLKKK